MLADLPAAKVWTNWVGNQSFTPGYSATPRDEEEVAALVRDLAQLGSRVRVAGAGHSFTPVVSTDGLLLDLSTMSGVLDADPRRKRATALAGTPIREFYEPLWREGLALKNQGDIDTQQIAGAVATATHGSGIRNVCFSGVVRGVRLVTGAGEIRTIDESEPELLHAAQVSSACGHGWRCSNAGMSSSTTTAISASSGCPRTSQRLSTTSNRTARRWRTSAT